MVKLIESTRSTSHMGSLAIVRARAPRLGEEAGLNQFARYGAQGLEMKMVRVDYDDGSILGWFHAAVKVNDSQVTLIHLGSRETWEMRFERV